MSLWPSTRSHSTCKIFPAHVRPWPIFRPTGAEDIVFAGDDTLYALKMVSDTGGPLQSLIPPTRFGSVKSNRLSISDPTPQPLVVDIDNGGNPEILVNHWGDGKIWAFHVNTDPAELVLVHGFPIRTLGRVAQAPQITDLEADGILDLVALDEAGYIYTWPLDSGVVFAQPWPAAYGNAWSTKNSAYRTQTDAGYLCEYWNDDKAGPFAWQEYASGNSLYTTSGAFEQVWNEKLVKTDDAGSRNYFNQGPGLEFMKDYTVSGSFKFDSADAEFGVSFYSQWPTDDKKYSLVRNSDGYMNLYYDVDGNRTLLGTMEDSTASNTGTWYNYKVRLETTPGTKNRVKSSVWAIGTLDPASFSDPVWYLDVEQPERTKRGIGEPGHLNIG